jgi:hypothetical protein
MKTARAPPDRTVVGFMTRLLAAPKAFRILYNESCGKLRISPQNILERIQKQTRTYTTVFVSSSADLPRFQSLPSSSTLPQHILDSYGKRGKTSRGKTSRGETYMLGNWALFASTRSTRRDLVTGIAVLDVKDVRDTGGAPDEVGHRHVSICRRVRASDPDSMYLCSGTFLVIVHRTRMSIVVDMRSGSWGIAKKVVSVFAPVDVKAVMPEDEVFSNFAAGHVRRLLSKTRIL